MKHKYDYKWGDIFGRLIVIEKDIEKSGHDTFWKCQCTCGNIASIRSSHLANGKTKSCGCYRIEKTIERHKTHGHCGESIHNVWMSMIGRCKNTGASVYKDYGGRGIKVCDEWSSSFENFYEWAIANGYKKGLTIDRIDNNGSYDPDNCRWITQREQCWNRRNTTYIMYKGITKPLPQWCYELGLSYSKTRQRLFKLHWSVDRAFETV